MKGEPEVALCCMDDIKIIREFGILNRLFLGYMTKKITALDISYSDSIFLVNIGDREGATQEEISSLLAIDKAAIARSVKILVSKGYVRVEHPESDRRSKALFLTGQGKQVFEEINKMNTALVSYVLKDITAAERSSLLRQLEIIEEHSRTFVSSEKTIM